MTSTDNREPQSRATSAPGGNGGQTQGIDTSLTQPQPESQQFSLQETIDQQSSNHHPPPFDPMSQHHHSHSHHHGSPAFGSSSLGQSVVPDLMKVYESLTQSSTPQHHDTAQVPVRNLQTANSVQTQGFPQQQPVEHAPAGTTSQQSQAQQPQYQCYQLASAPAPAPQTAQAPADNAPPGSRDSSLFYYVHPQPEAQQQQQQQTSGTNYHQVTTHQQQGQYHNAAGPPPQQQQAPQQYVAYPPQHAPAPRVQGEVGNQQPRGHPPAVAGTESPSGALAHPPHGAPVPVYHTQQAQTVQPQHTNPPAHVPLLANPNPAPPPAPLSSVAPQHPPVRSSRKRASPNGSDDGSTVSRPRPRKKGGSSDGRWSKRFQWPDELHREFVSAVFDVGLKNSSPSAISECMTPNETITSERVKSHLQKYRLHRERSKREFMASYDSAMGKFKSSPEGVLTDKEEVRTLSSGAVAAHLSCSTISDPDAKSGQSTNSENASPLPPLPAPHIGQPLAAAPVVSSAPNQAAPISSSEAQAVAQQGSYSGGALHLPQLTEEEKRSPIGASMGYLMGLFFSLEQQLAMQRASTAPRIIVASTANRLASSAVSPGSAGKYVPIIASPQQGVSTQTSQSRALMPPPQSIPAPVQAQFSQPTQSPATQARPQDEAPRSNPNPPAPAGSAGQTSAVSHPPFEPPPANARHPTQPHLPLHSHSASIIEENDMMKRDMRSQMAFQNKMRALKEQEQRKYRTTTDASGGAARNDAKSKEDTKISAAEKCTPGAIANASVPRSTLNDSADATAPSQFEGEPSNGDGLNLARSPNTATEPPSVLVDQAPDDFWNADVVDEQLFEFLMS